MATQASSPGKLDAMSRALGAAFLNHQVEMLEQSVSESRAPIPPRNGASKGGKELNRNSNGALSVKSHKRETSRDMDQQQPLNLPGLDADIIVTDASLLIHSLSYVHNVLHPGRRFDTSPSRQPVKEKGPVVVIPLEALNTLDLLKKGTTPSAKRAREASRLLEREVGENPQIRIQAETEYIGWDAISFNPDTDSAGEMQSPEWVRRTVCCGMWELKNANSTGAVAERKPKVLMAVCTTIQPTANTAAAAAAATSSPYPSKHDFRANGSLITHWSKRAGIEMLDVPADPPKPPPAPRNRDGRRSSPEAEHPPNGSRRGPNKSGRRPPSDAGGPPSSSGPSFKTNKTKPHPESSSPPKNKSPMILSRGPGGGGKGLVDKPPTVLGAMPPGKVIRVLARGEKLDPDD